MSASAAKTPANPPRGPNRPPAPLRWWSPLTILFIAVAILILLVPLVLMDWVAATYPALLPYVHLFTYIIGVPFVFIAFATAIFGAERVVRALGRVLAGIVAFIRWVLTTAVTGLLRFIGVPLWYCGVRVLWRCAYASMAVAAVAFLFLVNDQGQDLLRLSAEQSLFSLWNVSFLISAALLGLSLWYSTELLLSTHPWGEDATWNPAAINRLVWPFLYGLAVPLILAWGFYTSDAPDQAAALSLAEFYKKLAIGLAVLFSGLRVLSYAKAQRAARRRTATGGPRLARPGWVLHASLIFCFLLLVAFLISPVTVPQLLGAPAIVLFGLTGIALFGGIFLTHWLLSRGLPPASAMALLAVVALFGVWNDNHGVRTAPTQESLTRQGAAEHFAAWRAADPDRSVGDRTPVILVAASGGGIRAAYWTAATLATMQTLKGFSDHLFAISGVSGGSVGAAVYTAIDYRNLIGPKSDSLQAVKDTLGRDFLSPVVAGLLFPDLVQRFLPVPIAAFDRQRFLELSFEQALGGVDNPLAGPVAALYQSDALKYRLPSLLLNTTVVDSGQRAVVSNIDLTGFTDTPDLLAKGYQTETILLSAAAGASARFTYVSPAGSLIAPGKDQERQKIRLVDGGYFENSGAATTMDLLSLLPRDKVYPILILIRNDATGAAVCKGRPQVNNQGIGPAGPPAARVLTELSSPLFALLNARSARGRLAEVDAAKRVEAMGGAVIEVSLAAVMRQQLQDARAANDQEAVVRIKKSLPEPPLGWSLSRAMRESMDRTLADAQGGLPGGGGLEAEFRNLSLVLSGQRGGYRPCNAR